MTGAEFIRAIRRLGRRKTVVRDRKKEPSRGLLADMLGQLGLGPRDLD